MDGKLHGRELALKICRCELAHRCRSGEALPCSRVANWSADPVRQRYPAPEPWSGHLDRARILFISSNPGAGEEKSPPKTGAATIDLSDDALFDMFDNAFEADGRPGRIVKGEFRDDGSKQPYWAWALETAKVFLERMPEPGIDYALTEAVHCGSKREKGVDLAVGPCTERYLSDLLRLSPARLVLAVGGTARNAISTRYKANGVEVRLPRKVIGPVDLENRTRLLVGTWHPSYALYGHDVAISTQVSEDDLARIRAWIRGT